MQCKVPVAGARTTTMAVEPKMVPPRPANSVASEYAVGICSCQGRRGSGGLVPRRTARWLDCQGVVGPPDLVQRRASVAARPAISQALSASMLVWRLHCSASLAATGPSRRSASEPLTFSCVCRAWVHGSRAATRRAIGDASEAHLGSPARTMLRCNALNCSAWSEPTLRHKGPGRRTRASDWSC